MLINPNEPKKPADVEIKDTSQNVNFEPVNAFDVYLPAYTKIYGDNTGALDEENFAAILRGEAQTDDILALRIIEAANQDDDKETLSSEEFEILTEKLKEEEGIEFSPVQISDYSPETLVAVFDALDEYSGYINDIITKYYPEKSYEDLTDSDIQKALFVESLANNTNLALGMIDSYFDTEGWVDNGYNFLKELTNLGLSDEDIKNYAQNEQFKNLILQKTLTNGSIRVSDNPQNLTDDELLAQGAVSKDKIISIATDKIANSSSIEDIVSYCKGYLKMSEEDIISSLEDYVSHCETSLLTQGLNYAPEDLGEFGIKVKIEKGDDGKYYVSTDDYRSAYLNEKTEFSEYFNNSLFYKSNKSKGEFYDLSGYILKNLSLKEEYQFEDMYSFLSGVEYNEDKIAEVSKIAPAYKQALSTYYMAENFEEEFENFTSPTQVVQYYVDELNCSWEEGIECFNEYYKTNIAKLNDSNGYENQFGKCISFELSPDGTTLEEKYYMDESQYYSLASSGMILGDYDYDSEAGIYTQRTSTEVMDIARENQSEYTDTSSFRNLNSEINSQNIISNQAISAFNESETSKEYGTFDEVIEKYTNLVNEAYGQNILNDKFEAYRLDMDTYASKIASTIALTGLALSFTVGGSFGLMALIGGFSDNFLDLVNLATNKKENELGQWSLQFAKEAGAVAIGIGLGSFAGQVGDSVCANLIRHNSSSFGFARAVGTGVEALLDFGVSYPADVLYESMFTGEFDWEGNLFGNILGSAMDIRGGIGAYRAYKAATDGFDYRFQDGTLLHLDNDGTGYMTYTDGSVELIAKELGEDSTKMTFNPESNEIVKTELKDTQTDVPLEYSVRGDSAGAELKVPNVEEIAAGDSFLVKELSKLSEDKLLKVTDLVNDGIEPLYAYQIGRLSDNQTQQALSLIKEGVPASRAADAAVLFDTQSQRILTLMSDNDVNNYYVADLAILSDKEYEVALRAIKNGVSAPSAIENVQDLVKAQDLESAIEGIKKGKMKIEITPEADKELLDMAKALSSEYERNAEASRQSYMEMLLEENQNVNDVYADISARVKGEKSILAKLKSKYESGDIKLSGDVGVDCKEALSSMTDAYGGRVVLKPLTSSDVDTALEQHGITEPNARKELGQVMIKIMNNGTLDDADEKYVKVINTLKEKQNDAVYKSLCKYITDGGQISEISNYGNLLTSYFTDEQLAGLMDLYYNENQLWLKITTQNNESVIKKASAVLDMTSMFGKMFYTSDGKVTDDIRKVIVNKNAIKKSGYAATQIAFIKEIDGKQCYSELQIRGSGVNAIGDVEHIPYDIRQNKITAKDIEYQDIYGGIRFADNDSYTKYNTYLSRVYSYSRIMEEYGLSLEDVQGIVAPELTYGSLKYKDGTLISEDIVRRLSIDSLLQYSD